ncbi:low molecular weight protein-tyrosine-phosphatase [Thalassomonas sp. M1454]|uniref:low molecular weight protein-tyrosine-phosphatase n=1 Tax=Thalassomonas sp. M1454 TaxID=2594477 RepID=UPI001180D027|nr:low molecular weight protein-tyrosine-phosphatase [Thalassomonas sp. M1454]TRX57202.1 low molecular weight phosphotyrosine protein phosphatase [Thalassomonas sp. M1454]
MFNNILTVCIGNICRSPSAERILQQLLPSKGITSAGIGALVDHEIETNAAELLKVNGYNSDNHKARQVNDDIIQNAELILVMEKKHQQVLMKKYPAASGKIMLLGKWNNEQEIPDPYKRSNEAFEHAYQLIEKNCQAWAQKLK